MLQNTKYEGTGQKKKSRPDDRKNKRFSAEDSTVDDIFIAIDERAQRKKQKKKQIVFTDFKKRTLASGFRNYRNKWKILMLAQP